jgi:hypothetical protein
MILGPLHAQRFFSPDAGTAGVLLTRTMAVTGLWGTIRPARRADSERELWAMLYSLQASVKRGQNQVRTESILDGPRAEPHDPQNRNHHRSNPRWTYAAHRELGHSHTQQAQAMKDDCRASLLQLSELLKRMGAENAFKTRRDLMRYHNQRLDVKVVCRTTVSDIEKKLPVNRKVTDVRDTWRKDAEAFASFAQRLQ